MRSNIGLNASTRRFFPISVSLILIVGTSLILTPVIQFWNGIKIQGSRDAPATHVLIIALDARGGEDAGLPDALFLLDLEKGTRQSIPRDWTKSRIEPSRTLVDNYLDLPSCEPFCSIQGVYVFGGALTQDSNGHYKGLEMIRTVVQTEYEIENLGLVVFDLTWARTFLYEVGLLEMHVESPIPIGGRSVNGVYTDVERYILTGNQLLNGEELFWFARARYGTSNEDRMERQSQLISQLLSKRNLAELAYFALSAEGLFMTDLGVQETLVGLWALKP